jgi:hypothetical protein
MALIRENLFMSNNSDSGMFDVKPIRNLTISHQKDATNPRRKLENRPKRVAQFFVILVAMGITLGLTFVFQCRSVLTRF